VRRRAMNDVNLVDGKSAGEESSIRDLSSNLFGNPPTTTTEAIVVSLRCLD
jgi:hypothetical protein